MQYYDYLTQTWRMDGYQDDQFGWNDWGTSSYNSGWNEYPCYESNDLPNVQREFFKAYHDQFQPSQGNSLEDSVAYVANNVFSYGQNIEHNFEKVKQNANKILALLNQESQEHEISEELSMSKEENWAAVDGSLATVHMEYQPTPTSSLEQHFEGMSLVSPDDIYDSHIDENEDTYSDKSYEEIEVETREGFVKQRTTELEAACMYSDDEDFYDVFTKQQQCPNVKPLTQPNQSPSGHSLPPSSVYVCSPIETLQLVNGQKESPWNQGQVEMVSREHHRTDKEVLLLMLGGFMKKKRQWKKRKKKRKKNYFSVVTKGSKLLTRAHLVSLKKVKHLIEPRPKPPDYT